MDTKWLCPQCHTYSSNPLKCSFCSKENPENKQAVNEQEEKLTLTLHKAIDKLRYNAKVKMYRWMEDNLI